MPSDRFTRQYGQISLKTIKQNMPTKVKTLALHVCEHIKTNKQLVGALTMQNIRGFCDHELQEEYQRDEILQAVKAVSDMYKTIDKKMWVEWTNNQLVYKRTQ